MKKVFLLFALIAAINFVNADTVNLSKFDKSKIALIDSTEVKIDSGIVDTVLSQLSADTALQSKLIAKVDEAKAKHKGNFFFDNLFWICLIFVTLFGAVVSNIKTKKAYRWLQPIQKICKWLFQFIIVPENKRK
jgi:hypothetical protein